MNISKLQNIRNLGTLLIAGLLLLSCNGQQEEEASQPNSSGSSSETDNSNLQFNDGDDFFRGQAYGDMVYLSWQEKAGQSYRVFRQNPTYQQSPTLLDEVPVASVFYKDRNLLINRDYYYKLQACSAASSCTDVGSTLRLSITEPNKPEAIPIITDVSYDSSTSQTTIRWDQVPSAHKYSLWRSELTGNLITNSILLNSSILETSTTDPSVELNKRYLYSVKACSSQEKCSGFSAQYAVAIEVNIIADPFLNSQNIENNKVIFSWDKVTLADKYEIQRRIDSNPYVFIAFLSYNKFIDAIAPGVNATLKYKIRGVSDKWGMSGWIESQEFVFPSSVSSSSSLSISSATARTSAALVPNLPSITPPEPRVLITPKAIYAFWNAAVDDSSSNYFQVRVNQKKPAVLSPNNPSVRVSYLAGDEVEFYACSDTYYACNKRFIINTSNLAFPQGQSQQAEVTARLPEVTGLAWHSNLAEDFVHIVESGTLAFHQLLNPPTDDNDKQAVKITGLEQGKSYVISMLNCQETDKKSMSLCLDMSSQTEVRVPEYSLDIGFSWLQGKWNKSHLPVFAFDDLNSEQPYHLVIDRQCVGLACLDLSQDVNQMLETIEVSGTPALITDVLLADLTPESWNQNNASLGIIYNLSLCLPDWTLCGMHNRLEVPRNQPAPTIMATNPSILAVTTPLKLAFAHVYQPEEQPIALHVDRNYSDRLQPSPDKNFQQVVRHSYRFSKASKQNQIIKIDKVNRFSSNLPWYHYRKQLSVSIETQGGSISANLDSDQSLLIQDDLSNKSIEGVERIIAVNDTQTCVQLNDGAVSCLGDSDLTFSFLPEQNQRIATSVIDKQISVPALPAYALTDSSRCDDTSGNVARVLSPESTLVSTSSSVCLINKQGQPLCLNHDNAGTSSGVGSADAYLCPLTSIVALKQLEATTEAEHLCSLDAQGRSYCWGNLESAVPDEQIQTYYANPTQVRFFRGRTHYPAIANILTGKGYSCMSLSSEEYCYSQDNGWFNQSWPAQINFPYSGGIIIDKAAYKGLICWLHNDNSSSYVHCIKSEGQPTAYQLPEAASQIDSDNTAQAFLLARLSANISNKAQLWLTKKAVCVFDAPSLWCAGDIGYNDYIYSQQALLELAEVRLPYKPLHDFAASDDGRFCVSFGAYQRLGCWQSYNKATSALSPELPEKFWPLMPDSPATSLVLAPEYSCAIFSLSIGCWGKTVNPVVNVEQAGLLVRATPVMETISIGRNITQLVAGRSAACYQSNNQWNCWGRLSSLGQWFELSSEDQTVPLSAPIRPVLESGIESIALAKHYNAMCVVTADQAFVYCSKNNKGVSFSYEKTNSDEFQPKQITDRQGKAIIAVSKPVYVGTEGVCALARIDNSSPYAVYCWGESSVTGQQDANGQSHQAVKVIDNVPRDSQLLANSNADASLAYVLVYNPTTGTVDYWGQNKQVTLEPRRVTWPLALQSLSIWPSDEPVLLGLTNNGHVYWQNLHRHQSFSSLPSFSSVSALTTGTDNICLRLAASGQLVCAGDNSFGKSGLIEQTIASGISQIQ